MNPKRKIIMLTGSIAIAAAVIRRHNHKYTGDSSALAGGRKPQRFQHR